MFDMYVCEPHIRFAGKHCNRRGHASAIPDRLFHCNGRLEILRVRQAVGDDRRFQCDDWRLSAKGVLYIRTDMHLHIKKGGLLDRLG